METRRFLQHLYAAEAALWEDNRELFEGIACEIASRYELPTHDAELVAADIRKALWAELGSLIAAHRRKEDPLPLMKRLEGAIRKIAYRAAIDAAEVLLPDERRLQLVDQRRARRRKNPSSDKQSVQN